MNKVRLQTAAISLLIAPATLHGVEGTGSDVAQFTPEPGLNIVEISVSGNRDEIGPENFMVTCTGVSDEDSLVANEVASSWSGRSLVRVESPRVLCEVVAAQQARWRITFVSQGSSSSGTSDSPRGEATRPAARQQGTSQSPRAPLPMSERARSAEEEDWYVACKRDGLTGELELCQLRSPPYWPVGEGPHDVMDLTMLHLTCKGAVEAMVRSDQRITRARLGDGDPVDAKPVAESLPWIATLFTVADRSWTRDVVAFEAVDDLEQEMVWRIPTPADPSALDEFELRCEELRTQ